MKIINLGVLAHVDAGKTTVTEGLLVHSGVKRAMGRVDSGTTTTDSMMLERQRGMTIRASTVSFTWQDTKINLIDTPGHKDFIAEVERSLMVLDGVILVLSGREGVQSQTRVIFRKLKERGIPVLLFLNKLDRTGVDMEGLRHSIGELLTPDALYLQAAHNVGTRDLQVEDLPLDTGALFEEIVSRSEPLLARYLAEEPLDAAACQQELVRLTRSCQAYPMLMGAALHDIGVQALLPAIAMLFAGQGDPQGPLSAYVYKVAWDGHQHKWLYVRLFSGMMRVRTQVEVAGQEEPVFLRTLYGARDGKIVPVGQLQAGDIGLLLDLPLLRCGDSLGQVYHERAYDVATPLLRCNVSTGDPAQRSALITALKELAEEDPFLELHLREDTEEITIRLFGALQVEIIQSLLQERFGLNATLSEPKVVGKQKPRQSVEAAIRFGKSPYHHAAGMALRLDPLPPGRGLEYETRVSFGDLTRSFQNGAREGILAGMEQGLEEGLTDTKATLLESDYDSVSSTPADFRRLGPEVVRKALESVPIQRLMPWQTFTLSVPLEYQRQTMQILGDARAILEQITFDDREMHAQGTAPMERFQSFPAAFHILTQGKGLVDVRFDRYQEEEGEGTAEAISSRA